MIRSLGRLSLLVVGIGCGSTSQRASLPANPDGLAEITPLVARFAIPLGRDTSGTWDWYSTATADNEDEYVWQIRVDGRETYWFGYSLFKPPGRTPRSGGFHDLIAAGQASVFRREGRQARRVPEVAPTLVGGRDRLIVELRDSVLISRVFGDRPRVVHIETKEVGGRTASYAVPVSYVGF